MPTLGILILWSGYLVGIFGFQKISSARGTVPGLTISDLALPSHRATYLSTAALWSNAGAQGVPAGATPYPKNPGPPGSTIPFGGVNTPNPLYIPPKPTSNPTAMP
jgi:hypothetical protein